MLIIYPIRFTNNRTAAIGADTAHLIVDSDIGVIVFLQFKVVGLR